MSTRLREALASQPAPAESTKAQVKRPRSVSAKQMALQGIDLPPVVEPAPKKSPAWGKDGARRASVKSLPGELVPLPKDRNGQELRLGPLAVLQTVWGRHFVMDYRRALGDGEIFTGTKRACVVRMVELHTTTL
jgi:hypothetical protein